VDSEYLQQLGEWLSGVELRIGGPRAANEEESVRELKDALGAAQAAILRMLAERRMLARSARVIPMRDPRWATTEP
jgi:hypothetical protein